MKKNIIRTLQFIMLQLLFITATQAAGDNFLESLVSNSTFKKIIDLGFILIAGYDWFMFFQNIDPSKVLKDAIKPGILTFLAFNWVSVLGWVGLIPKK